MGLPFIAPVCRPALFEILIVEDHPMMIRSITASLEVLHLRAHAGCSVMVVSTMRQAKKRLLGREPPALIISDLHLPDSRGLGTLHALLVAAPGTPINTDVLNAQQQWHAAQRDWHKARVDSLMSALRLKAAVGELGDADLAASNALLMPPQP